MEDDTPYKDPEVNRLAKHGARGAPGTPEREAWNAANREAETARKNESRRAAKARKAQLKAIAMRLLSLATVRAKARMGCGYRGELKPGGF